MTLSKDQMRLKDKIAIDYADLIYNGLWFTAHHQDIAAYMSHTQRHVNGTVRMKLWKGSATKDGVKSPDALYQHSLATYDEGDKFDQKSAIGFIHIWGLPVRVQAPVRRPLAVWLGRC